MLRLPDIGRLSCLVAVFLVLSIPGAGKGYDPGALSLSDLREVRGWSSYARARYLIAERSTDEQQIAQHLRDCLIAMPDAEIPLRLLLLIRNEGVGLLEDISKVVAANPENVRVNVVYAEILEDARRTDEACRHLLDFMDKTGWRHPEPVIRLLQIKAAAAKWVEGDQFLGRALRQKALRQHPKLQVFQAFYILQRGESAGCVGEKHLAGLRKAQSLIQPFLEKPELLHDWELFTSLFPVLVKLQSWEQMNRLLDGAPEDFTRTRFWFKNKLLALEKLRDVEGLQALSREVFAAPEQSIEAIEEIARTYIGMKEIDKAIEIFELLHLRNIRSMAYRLELAWLYLLRGSDSKGMALLAAVRDLPFRGLILKAEFMKMRQQPAKAVEVYQQAEKAALASEELSYLDSTFYVTYALTAEKAGQPELAIEKFRRAHQLEPENSNICNGLGYTLADHNQDLQFAEQLIEKAVQAEPDNIAFLDSLAWVRFRQKKYSTALEALLRTLTVFQSGQDSDGVIHQHAGDIFAAGEYPLLAELFRSKAAWERMAK